MWLVAILVCASSYANINSNGQLGLIRTMSAKTFGGAKLNVGAGVNYAQSKNFLTWTANADKPTDAIETSKMLSSNLFLALGLGSFIDFAAALPFYWDGTEYGASDFGIGDLDVSLKILYPAPDKPRLFYQSYLVGVSAGLSGMQGRGIYPRHGYYYQLNGGNASYTRGDIFTANGFVVKGLMLWSFDFGYLNKKAPFTLDINAGAAIPNSQKAITGLVNAALEYSPSEIVTIFVDVASELRGETVLSDIQEIRKEMMWITPGLKITSPAGVVVSIAADLGLSDNVNYRVSGTDRSDSKKTYTTGMVPPFGVQFNISWNGFLTSQDDDRDGIKNDIDKCPKVAEDIDGFEDSDGCPDYDNDKDGIPDSLDKCSTLPEDFDGFDDKDGCPDFDNDRDGIPDSLDKCSTAPEDFDGFEDNDGCPDLDNDKDGLADSVDRCPNEPEDFDGYEDANGCPDPDNDHDGLPDLRDKCPNVPENFNTYKDDDGCPDTIPLPVPPAPVVIQKKKESTWPKNQTLTGVSFKLGFATLVSDASQALDPLLSEMRNFPDIEIEIRAFSDNIGKPSVNLELTQLRAEAVKQYLISKGIDSSRLRAVGFGSSTPVADNRTATGRALNRRLEAVRLK